jgi:hypothetical protein
MLVVGGQIGLTLEEDTLRDRADNLKDHGTVVTVNQVVNDDTV